MPNPNISYERRTVAAWGQKCAHNHTGKGEPNDRIRVKIIKESGPQRDRAVLFEVYDRTVADNNIPSAVVLDRAAIQKMLAFLFTGMGYPKRASMNRLLRIYDDYKPDDPEWKKRQGAWQASFYEALMELLPSGIFPED